MKREEARVRIVSAFRLWKRENGYSENELPSGTDAFKFYLGLERARSELLSFAASGDKWQDVNSWLRRAGLVSI